MFNERAVCAVAALIFIAGVAGGCASTKGKSASATTSVAPTREETEAQLRAIVDEELAKERKNQGRQGEDVVYKRPFYYKEYFEFPTETGVYSLDFTEKESRTTPLTAELEVEKVRFATKLYKDRDEARGDENYYRSRGIDHTSYELRSGKWRKAGGLFLAKSTEENTGGEWKPVLEKRRPRAIIQDEPTHWYDRLKFWKTK